MVTGLRRCPGPCRGIISFIMSRLVRFRIPKTRYDAGRTAVTKEWKNVPIDIHPRAQVHYNNGVGWPGCGVRYKRDGSDVWIYMIGELRGDPGKSKTRVFTLDDVAYSRHRLVQRSYVTKPPTYTKRNIVCHINRRTSDDPDDSVGNLYWGTWRDNMNDVEKNGVAQPGNRRSVFGRATANNQSPEDASEPGDGSWEKFASLGDAADSVGVSIGTIRNSIMYGRLVGQVVPKWEFRYAPMKIREAEEMKYVPGSSSRVVTSHGRRGEYMRSRGERTLVEIEGVCTNEDGYEIISVQGTQRRFHRLVVELFAPHEIRKYVEDSGIPWNRLEVDHEDGKKSNNCISNLKIVTRKEHNAKRNKPVEEVDERGVPTGEKWISIAAASDDTGINTGTLTAVCNGKGVSAGGGKGKPSGGRFFRFVT